MIDLKLQLPEKLEQHLEYLAIVSKRPKEFILKEAFIQYLENAEDIQAVEAYMKKENKEHFTSEEIDHLLEQKGLKEMNV